MLFGSNGSSYTAFAKSDMYIQSVPLATEPGISLIIITLMKILQRNLNRSTFVVWEMKRNVSVVRLIVATRSSGPPASQFGSEWHTLYIRCSQYKEDGRAKEIKKKLGPQWISCMSQVRRPWSSWFGVDMLGSGQEPIAFWCEYGVETSCCKRGVRFIG